MLDNRIEYFEMEQKKIIKINRIIAIVVLAFASFVYLATIEPTVSFWDCGEFIASAYKLEVGHAPGNPVFQLFAHFFTLFTDAEHAAAAVNCCSALCSSFTIFFLFLTIVHFGRRIVDKKGKQLSLGSAITIWGAGLVGALAYCFSDTFWFSAVEGEVYAMSSLFTALVFWCILKWEEQADEKYANRWIILLCFLTGLSIGVHLLNLLIIPGIVFIIFYKKHEGEKISLWKNFLILCLGGLFLFLVLYIIIPYLPKILAVADRIFVNGFGTSFNVGATVCMILIFALCFFLLKRFRAKGKVMAHTATLGLTTMLIGYSVFAIVLIRSAVGTPTNENQPDNPYSLIRYLSREQFGSNPIIFGQQYTSVVEGQTKDYYTPLDDKYVKVAAPLRAKYPKGATTLFPRMWSTQSPSHEAFYNNYTQGNFKVDKVQMSNGEWRSNQMPYFKDNMRFFFDYQLNYMYFRYFFWNFVGRQNDFQGQNPSELMLGNWESGIRAIDEARLGDQSMAPDYFANNDAKNHYYFLPLILGLIGLFFQINKDGKGSWVNFLLFFLTGIAIIIYLNQPPMQVRERDYAYAGSFYMFSIWIGLAVLWIKELLDKVSKSSVANASIATVLCLVVPIIMGCENWDDHDRSNRYTALSLAKNYLNSCDEQAILITHGDNDTFPLWYAQEVENIRTDIRIMNTSLLGMDWYIDQMKCKMYESEPLLISLPRIDYLYGTNDYVPVIDALGGAATAEQVMNIFINPKYRQEGNNGIITSKTIRIPVNKENVKKYKIVPENQYDNILDYIELTINEDAIQKSDLITINLLSNYQWDRPIYYVSKNGDGDYNIGKYLRDDGFAYKLVPLDCKEMGTANTIDTDMQFDKFMNVFDFEPLTRDFHVDYQNLYTFTAVSPYRSPFLSLAEALIKKGEIAKAVQILDKCVESMPFKNFPTNISMFQTINEYDILSLIEYYFICGETQKSLAVCDVFVDDTDKLLMYFGQDAPGYRDGVLNEQFIKNNLQFVFYLNSLLKAYNQTEYADNMMIKLKLK